ncbi:MAG: hypothetical protein O7C75_13620 [Verrucomicrobia bacterium]|nr:hypothetical protein [Verrucomicrobiota bacterium]
MKSFTARLFWGGVAVAVIAVGGVLGVAFLKTGLTIQALLTENKDLKQAIENLTGEEQIGYAKVIAQMQQGGKDYTLLKFVETARNDPLDIVFESEFTLEGDIVHFDALIVKFSDEFVRDGKGRSLYLWRRIYGEHMAPSDGFPIEVHGREPERYRGLLAQLPVKKRELFWSEIWDLAHDKRRLSEYGIEAVFGSSVYTELRPGLIYIFKISATGQVYPEVIPDL